MPSLSKARLMGSHHGHLDAVKEFVYRRVETPNQAESGSPESLPASMGFVWEEQAPAADVPPAPAGEKYTEEDVRALEQQAWQKGFDEAAAQSRENLEKSLARERSNVAAALCEFADGREAYYRRMEGEVVRLVLSIARKVLHREAQVDPMLLTGVVRVALEKIAGGTSVKLRVPVGQVELWRAAASSLPARDLAIEVAGDESLTGPHCLIVTEMGTTDVSLAAQLGEIERGFLDLLTEHPANGANGGQGL
ncbi:MAG: FliH/SctL family protein [Terriglobia bacterium]